MGIKHSKVSAVVDESDTSQVRPSDWNSDHTIDGDVDFNGFAILNATGVAGGDFTPPQAVPDGVLFSAGDHADEALIAVNGVTSAVNYLEVENAPAGSGSNLDGNTPQPTIRVVGSDTDIGMQFECKGVPYPGFKFNCGDQDFAPFWIQCGSGFVGPTLVFHNNVAAGAGSLAAAGGMTFTAFNSVGAFEQFGSVGCAINDRTDGSEDGYVYVTSHTAGSKLSQIAFGDGIIVGILSAQAFPGSGNIGIGNGRGIFDNHPGTSNEQIIFSRIDSAVNYLNMGNSVATSPPFIAAAGDDTNINLSLSGKGTGGVVFSTYARTTATTVSGLVAAATAGAGARAFVTDATVTTFASVVAGTGGNGVPVYSDGTNWRIG